MVGYKKIAHLLPEILETANQAGEMREEVLRVLIDHALANANKNGGRDVQEPLGVEEKKAKREPKPKAELKAKEEKKKKKTRTEKLERHVEQVRSIVEVKELPLEHVSEFMAKYQIAPETMRKLYGYTEQGIVGKYMELKTSKKSEAQVNAALLRTVANALTNGSFSASIDEIKQEYKEFGILDTNIKVNLERRRNFFSVFDFKEKIELSEEGKQAAAELIKQYE